LSRLRRDQDIGVTVSRRDRNVQKTPRDRDVRDRDYNPRVGIVGGGRLTLQPVGGLPYDKIEEFNKDSKAEYTA